MTSERRRGTWISTAFLVGALCWSAAFAAGLIILFTPEAPKRPLVRSAEWQLDGLISEGWRPQAGEVSASIIRNPESRFFRFSNRGANSPTATIHSRPFIAPEYIAVPFAGYPGERGVDLWLECVGSGRHLRLARGNAHETWVERTVRLGPNWCRTFARLVASSSSSVYWIGVGTPFVSSRLAWLKESVFVHVVIHCLAWMLLLGPGVLGLALSNARPRESHLVMVMSTLALGYFQFFVSYYAPRGAGFVAAVFAAAAFVGMLLGVRWILNHWHAAGSVVTPIATAFVLSLFYLGVLYAGDVGSGSYEATYRFDPAIWSTDNQLPQMVAETIYKQRSIVGLLGDWHVSDRPPLMSGVMLLERPLWQLFLAPGDNARLLYLFYQVSGIVMTCVWVIPTWILLGTARLRPRQRLVAIILMGTLGPIVFNSTYIWPKMLAAALALAGCLVLAHSSSRLSSDSWSPVAGGALIGLGMMAHSGVVFGLPVAILAALARRGSNVVRAAIVSAVAAATVIFPWTVWQRMEDPPGNALTKFAFAGTYGVDEPKKGIVETVREAYTNLSFRDWLGMRVEAVHTLVDRTDPATAWLYTREMDAIGRERVDDFLKLGQSLRVLNAGWLVFATYLILRPFDPRSKYMRTCARWAAIGLTGILLNVLLTWSVHITHTQSYLSVLLIVAGLCAAVVLTPPWVRVPLVMVHTLYFLIVWIWSPLRQVNVATGPLFASVLAAATLVLLAVWAEDGARAPSTE